MRIDREMKNCDGEIVKARTKVWTGLNEAQNARLVWRRRRLQLWLHSESLTCTTNVCGYPTPAVVGNWWRPPQTGVQHWLDRRRPLQGWPATRHGDVGN